LIGEGNETFLIRVWKRRVLKTVSLTTIRNGPKRTIFISGELEVLQIITNDLIYIFYMVTCEVSYTMSTYKIKPRNI